MKKVPSSIWEAWPPVGRQIVASISSTVFTVPAPQPTGRIVLVMQWTTSLTAARARRRHRAARRLLRHRLDTCQWGQCITLVQRAYHLLHQVR